MEEVEDRDERRKKWKVRMMWVELKPPEDKEEYPLGELLKNVILGIFLIIICVVLLVGLMCMVVREVPPLKRIADICVAGVFFWLILKAIAQVLAIRVEEKEARVRWLERETKILEGERLKKEAGLRHAPSTYTEEAIAELRQEIEARDRTIEELRQKIEERNRGMKEREEGELRARRTTPGQTRKMGGVYIRKRPGDKTLIEMGNCTEEGGIVVISSISIEDARRLFDDDVLRVLAHSKDGEWVEARGKGKADFE